MRGWLTACNARRICGGWQSFALTLRGGLDIVPTRS